MVKGLKSVHLYITKYSPMRVGSYIPLPEPIKKKQCLLNINNTDNKLVFEIYAVKSMSSVRYEDKLFVIQNCIEENKLICT